MLKILLLPFALLVVVILFLAGIINAFVRALFGRRRSGYSDYYGQTNRQSQGKQSSKSAYSEPESSSKKVISKDEGEYVDFEEVE